MIGRQGSKWGQQGLSAGDMFIEAQEGNQRHGLLSKAFYMGSEGSRLTCVMRCALLKLNPAAQNWAGTTPRDWLAGTELATSLSMPSWSHPWGCTRIIVGSRVGGRLAEAPSPCREVRSVKL